MVVQIFIRCANSSQGAPYTALYWQLRLGWGPALQGSDELRCLLAAPGMKVQGQGPAACVEEDMEAICTEVQYLIIFTDKI